MFYSRIKKEKLHSATGWESLLALISSYCMCVCVCEGLYTHMQVKKKLKKKKQKNKRGKWRVFGTHTHTTWAACALLTLPFAPVVCKASGGGGVVSLDLRRRPFSWPLSASEEPSLPSARFLARSVFQERDFLYGTGTTETSTGQSKRSCPARFGCDVALRTPSTITAAVKEQWLHVIYY